MHENRRQNFVVRRLSAVGGGASRVPEVDGLRGLAILLVLVWHASLRAVRYLEAQGAHETWYAFFPHGELGVGLFFFLSGFVLASPVAGRGLDGFSATRFYQRRFTRIYPPYAIALIGCFGLIILSGFKSPTQTVSPLASLLASLAYLHAAVFDQPSALNPPVWSLEVEIQFYLLAPFLLKGYFSIGALRSRLLAGLAVTLALIAMLLFLRVGQPVEGRFRLGMATHAYLFAAGIVAADLYTHKALRGVSRWADGIALVGLAGYAMVGLFLTKVDAKPEGGLEATWVALAILVFTAMLFFAAVRGRLFGALMRQPWLR